MALVYLCGLDRRWAYHVGCNLHVRFGICVEVNIHESTATHTLQLNSWHCRILSKLFTTRVKLAGPPEGAAAAKHNARIAQDADKILAGDNYRVVKTLASAVG